MNKTKKRKIGDLGEELSLIYLKNKGHQLVTRNWEKPKMGEIDLITTQNDTLYFIEVKTTENANNNYSPLDHLDKNKMKRFERIVNHYLIENELIDKEYQLSACLVYIDKKEKKAKINFIENIY